ncbi:MAG: hypothetical protein L0H83_00005, partial [Salinisphaera sp.]|nr:hypothetical protein [Salinisphaera sp.]
MKRWIAIGFAGLLFSSSASAQIVAIPGADGGVLGLLLGENGVVPSLLVTLTTLDFGPTIDAVAGPQGTSGLVRGGAGVALNQTLTGALDPLLLTDLPQTVDGVQLLVTGLVDGLLAALTGEGAVGIPIIGGLLGGEGGLLGGLLGGEGGIPIIGGLLGGEGGIPIIGGLLGGEGGIP